MRKLNKEEMIKLEGGGVSPWLVLGEIGLVVLAVGIWDGFCRPLKCNK